MKKVGTGLLSVQTTKRDERSPTQEPKDDVGEASLLFGGPSAQDISNPSAQPDINRIYQEDDLLSTHDINFFEMINPNEEDLFDKKISKRSSSLHKKISSRG